jgi:hypothetical protein
MSREVEDVILSEAKDLSFDFVIVGTFTPLSVPNLYLDSSEH